MIKKDEQATVQRLLSAVRKSTRGMLREIRHTLRPEPTMLLNFKEFCANECSKRALVSYLVSPLLPPFGLRDRTIFSNLGIAQRIPQILNELGYVVDIIQYDLQGWNISGRYDLFIGHGGINFEEIRRQLSDDTTSIYFSTGIYWKEMNIREAKRLYDLALRRGHLLDPDRTIKRDEEFANRTADGIICLGNHATVNTYRDFPLVIGIKNATYPVTWSGWREKDYDKGRSHFLFFSGSGNIHKGLDLLLEVFGKMDLHLHICQAIDPHFGQVYQHELTNLPNIHGHGHLPMRSSQFFSLASLCNWVISATCAEGQPGSIIECMGYGLIPILPESANINLGEFGIELGDCSVNTIRKTVLEASKMPVPECRQRSRIVMTTVQKDYSPENFNNNFKSGVQKIVTETKERHPSRGHNN